MSGTSISKSEQLGLEDINSVAVTELKEAAFTFRWDIKNFKKRLENKKPEAKLQSPCFDCRLENNKLKWQLQIFWNKKIKLPNSNQEDTFLAVSVRLSNWKKSLEVGLQLGLVKTDKSFQKWSVEYEFTDPNWVGPAYMKISDLLDPGKEFLDDDMLKLQCRIVMKHDTVHQLKGVNKLASFLGRGKPKLEKEAAKRKHDLVTDYTNLFNSKTLADVSIQTKKTTFKAHKIILACRSPVFSAMFQSEMSESMSNIVDIPDFDDVVVQGMLQYIYCGELTRKILEDSSVGLFQIAEKYDIKGLKEETEEVLAVNLSMANVVESLILADLNNALHLKTTAIKFINMNKAKLKTTEGFQKLKKYNPSLFIDLYQDD